MTLAFDPEVAASLAPMAEAMAETTPPPVGDVETRRGSLEAITADAAGRYDHRLPRRQRRRRHGPAPLVRQGGRLARVGGALPARRGMIVGNFGLFDAPLSRYVSASGVPMLSVDYRVAPEHPHPAPVEDSYVGLRWLGDHADELGVDPGRVAVMGESAGGGLAGQILLFPMLDDRNTEPDPEIAPFAAWTYDDNATGWGALLGDAAGGPDVPAYAAPARATDLAGLPAAYVEVGQLDIFRDEDLEYARRLSFAGVPVEFHLHPGVPHYFDAIAFDSDVARRATADRIRFLGSL